MNLSKVILKHGYGQLKSRSDANTEAFDKNLKAFNSPIVLSNMPSVQNLNILRKFDSNHWAYVKHRICENSEIFNFVKLANEENWYCISISIGVQEKDLDLLKQIKDADLRLDWLTIDVAFIYNRFYIDFIKKVREIFPRVYLIAGNFTDYHSLRWLKDLGVDAAKFSIGNSQLCRTRQFTGFGTSLKDLIDCGREAQKLDIDLMNDGGLTILDEVYGEISYGDIFKVLNFGAKWQMSSSLFRWCPELADENGIIEQYGNSTARAKGKNKHVEGAVKLYRTNNVSVEEQMKKITEALQSSISYAGIKSLFCAYNSCNYEIDL